MVYIVLCVILLFILCIRGQQYVDVLIAIPSIDRDASILKQNLNNIAQFHSGEDILIVCRKSDLMIQQLANIFGTQLITVQDYDIDDRHNINQLANKRNIMMQYALEQQYEYLWFVDSDILVNKSHLQYLLCGIKKYDICAIPYKARWNGQYIVGQFNGSAIYQVPEIPFSVMSNRCGVVCMGCTMVRQSCFDRQFTNITLTDKKSLTQYYGEDLGFCLNNSDLNIGFIYKHVNHYTDDVQ